MGFKIKQQKWDINTFHQVKMQCLPDDCINRVSFSLLPKGGGGQMRLWIIGRASMYPCAKQTRGSGGMLSREILILNLLLDAIWRNLGLFSHKHNLSFIVSLKPLYYWFTCKIEFSAYPRGSAPPPLPKKNPWLICHPWKWKCSPNRYIMHTG